MKKGREEGVVRALQPEQKFAASCGDAWSNACALQHPYACEANPVPAEAQGTMRGPVSDNAHTTQNRWRIYEQLKRIAAAEALTPESYDACIQAITEELGL